MFSARHMIVATMLAVALPGAAAAQNGLMLKGGYSYGNVSNKDLLNANLGARSGYALGASIGTPGPLGLRVEGLYAQRGVDTRNLDYWDLSAALQVSAPLPLVSPFAYVGPMMSIEARCRDGGAPCPDTGRPKTSYAAIIGAGLKVHPPMLPALSLEGSFIYGFTDLKLATFVSPTTYKTRSFLILAGIGF